MKEWKNIKRRNFLAYTAAGISLFLIKKRTEASANLNLPKPTDGDLGESEPTAQALGYYKDAAKVDVKKWPKKVANQNCGNCQLYQAVPGESARGACVLFPKKWVAKAGWCNGYVPAAK